jgi:transposase
MPLFGTVRVKTTAGAGRPRVRPRLLVADRGYDAKVLRRYLHQRGIAHVIPERRETKRKRRRRGRPPKFCASTYRCRNVIERLIGWLKEHRRLATRFDKLASSFLAMVKLAFIRRYLTKLFSDSA